MENTLQSIDAVLGIYELPGVVVERLEDMIIREVQLLRGQKVVVIEDDVVQVPLIVRSLVEDDEGAFLENAPHLTVCPPKVLLVVDVARFHCQTDRYVDGWRELRHP